eukprot:Hpha_TRINITY_DN16266_c3_g3::TRINITY_DN16266_c3_g3_i1::g.11638::m.11638
MMDEGVGTSSFAYTDKQLGTSRRMMDEGVGTSSIAYTDKQLGTSRRMLVDEGVGTQSFAGGLLVDKGLGTSRRVLVDEGVGTRSQSLGPQLTDKQLGTSRRMVDEGVGTQSVLGSRRRLDESVSNLRSVTSRRRLLDAACGTSTPVLNHGASGRLAVAARRSSLRGSAYSHRDPESGLSGMLDRKASLRTVGTEDSPPVSPTNRKKTGLNVSIGGTPPPYPLADWTPRERSVRSNSPNQRSLLLYSPAEDGGAGQGADELPVIAVERAETVEQIPSDQLPIEVQIKLVETIRGNDMGLGESVREVVDELKSRRSERAVAVSNMEASMAVSRRGGLPDDDIMATFTTHNDLEECDRGVDEAEAALRALAGTMRTILGENVEDGPETPESAALPILAEVRAALDLAEQVLGGKEKIEVAEAPWEPGDLAHATEVLGVELDAAKERAGLAEEEAGGLRSQVEELTTERDSLKEALLQKEAELGTLRVQLSEYAANLAEGSQRQQEESERSEVWRGHLEAKLRGAEEALAAEQRRRQELEDQWDQLAWRTGGARGTGALLRRNVGRRQDSASARNVRSASRASPERVERSPSPVRKVDLSSPQMKPQQPQPRRVDLSSPKMKPQPGSVASRSVRRRVPSSSASRWVAPWEKRKPQPRPEPKTRRRVHTRSPPRPASPWGSWSPPRPMSPQRPPYYGGRPGGEAEPSNAGRKGYRQHPNDEKGPPLPPESSPQRPPFYGRLGGEVSDAGRQPPQPSLPPPKEPLALEGSPQRPPHYEQGLPPECKELSPLRPSRVHPLIDKL